VIPIWGFWEVPFSIPRDRRAYSCIVKLYDGVVSKGKTTIETTGYFYMDVMFRGGVWKASPSVGEEKTSGINPAYRSEEGKVMRNYAVEEKYLLCEFEDSWSCEPYGCYNKALRYYYPTVPLYRRRWFKEIGLTDTGSELVARIDVSGKPGQKHDNWQGGNVEISDRYFHRTLPTPTDLIAEILP